MTPDRSQSRPFGFLLAAGLGALAGALGVWGSLAIFGDRPPEVRVLPLSFVLPAPCPRGCPPVFRGRLLIHEVPREENPEEAALGCFYRIPGAMIEDYRDPR